jgi:hypothetical protein
VRSGQRRRGWPHFLGESLLLLLLYTLSSQVTMAQLWNITVISEIISGGDLFRKEAKRRWRGLVW